jgi:hypothetical protein
MVRWPLPRGASQQRHGLFASSFQADSLYSPRRLLDAMDDAKPRPTIGQDALSGFAKTTDLRGARLS